MKTVIVIGANGFIGSYLCRLLVEKGITVYGIVRSKESNLSDLTSILNSPSFNIIYCDMHELVKLDETFKNIDVDAMYFLSWQGITGNLRGDVQLQLDNISCLTGAVSLANKVRCKRFIGAGTTAENDVLSYALLDGSTPNLTSTYGMAKVTAHVMSKALCGCYGIEHIWAIIGNTYGLGDKSNNFVNYAIDLISSNKEKKFTAGEQFYDFVHVSDVANGLYCIGHFGKNNNSYYLGSGKARKLKEYILTIRDEVDRNAVVELGAIPYNGVLTPYSTFDCTKTSEDTGYIPRVEFADGIKEML